MFDMDSIPEALLLRLKEEAVEDLQYTVGKINQLVEYAKTDTSFDSHMSLIAALLVKYVNDPAQMAILLAESIFMLAEKDK